MGKEKFFIILFCIVIGFLYFKNSEESLFKGQAFKQFHAYFISKALEGGDSPFQTYIPCRKAEENCNGMKVWVEEPPLFHYATAFFLKLSKTPSWIIHLIWFSLFLLLVGWFYQYRVSLPEKFYIIFPLFFISLPISIRYSSQLMPDTMALLFLLVGGLLLFEGKSKRAYLLFMLSVTVKALFIFSVAALLFCKFFSKDKKIVLTKKGILNFSMLITLITAPFLIWLSYVSYNHIQSPFESGLNHSHMGSYSLLFDFKFLRKFISWNLFKGIGFILTVFFGLFLWNIRKRNLTEFEYFLLIWAAGVFPYWLLVRWGNQMHDYYSMQFMFPFSCLAVHEICRLGLHDFKKVWIYVLLTLQLVLAVNESLRLRPIEHSQFAEAPFLE